MPTVIRDGATLYYETRGEGEPLLCVMGLGCDSSLWERQVPAFERAHRVILLDNRGVGRSSKPRGPYSIAQLAADALAVLDAAGVERAHVLGLSMGGMIAQELALARPDRVGALVLAATYARPADELRDVERAGEAETGVPLAMLAQGGGAIDPALLDVKRVFKFFMSMVLSPEFMQREKPWLRSLLDRMLQTEPSIDAFLAQLRAVLAHDAHARLPSLRLPTLILTGDADRLVPPRHSDELHRLIAGSRLVKVEGGTHGFNIESPERFNNEVLAFLREHPLASLR